ncbi:phage major tail tube protein [Xanthobacter sp. TB0136]|uniref:phage major tail tube protein n=1 Tax=Xanthobacter sp. TB0136 TaxID=3459177 RepID=UPI004039A5C4
MKNIKLEKMAETYVDHKSGGGPVGVEFGVGMEKFGFSFGYFGLDPEMMVQFGLGTQSRRIYTIYNGIRDLQADKIIQRKMIIEARLGGLEEDQFSRGEAHGANYTLNEIMHFEMWWEGRAKPLFEWDFFSGGWVVGGSDQAAAMNAALGIGI